MKLFYLIFISLIIGKSYAQTYSLPSLKYSYNALEPAVDAQTMEIHHTKHHQAYINNLNKAIAGTKNETLPLNELLLNASTYSDVIRNNAGGHYNHSLFWEILTPKKDTKPSLELFKAIEQAFTSMDSLKKLINQAASTRFGSGWAWLVLTPDKKLAVSSTGNQDNPIMDVATVRGIPILGIDVWEHAYYLKYQNKRGDYLGAIWSIIDWENVSLRYTQALNDPLLQKIEQSGWTELKEFHKVLSKTYHPVEEGNFSPLNEMADELYLRAIQLQKSKIPSSLNNEKMIKKIALLKEQTQAVFEEVNNKGKENVLKDKMTALHTTFHEIEESCHQ